jgi:hypothetical protein
MVVICRFAGWGFTRLKAQITLATDEMNAVVIMKKIMQILELNIYLM